VDGCRALLGGDHAAALRFFRQCAEIPDGAFLAGYLCLDAGQFEDARGYLQTALANAAQLGARLGAWGVELVVSLPITPEITVHVAPGKPATQLGLVEACQALGDLDAASRPTTCSRACRSLSCAGSATAPRPRRPRRCSRWPRTCRTARPSTARCCSTGRGRCGRSACPTRRAIPARRSCASRRTGRPTCCRPSATSAVAATKPSTTPPARAKTSPRSTPKTPPTPTSPPASYRGQLRGADPDGQHRQEGDAHAGGDGARARSGVPPRAALPRGRRGHDLVLQARAADGALPQPRLDAVRRDGRRHGVRAQPADPRALLTRERWANRSRGGERRTRRGCASIQRRWRQRAPNSRFRPV
jgi:hypothetical protein